MRKTAVWILLYYFRFFARIALLVHRPTVIGIAGSVGKTSTKHALYAVLSREGRTIMTKGNSETGVPLGILGIGLEGYSISDWLWAVLRAPLGILNLVGLKYLIVEMGIDSPESPKNMSYLLSIVAPDIGVIIAESAAHTEQFEKILSDTEKEISAEARRDLLIERITQEDMKMVTHPRCQKVIYNADNSFIQNAIAQVSGKKLLSFGSAPSNALAFEDHEISLDRTTFRFHIAGEHFTVSIPDHILPREYREVFGAAALTANELGIPHDRIAKALSETVLPRGRSGIFQGINDSLIIDSSYNASKASVLAFLDLLFHLKQKTERPVVFCFGDMRELGKEAAIEHEAVAERIVGVVDYLYCVGSLTKQYVMPAVSDSDVQEKKWFANYSELGEYMRDHMPEEALVLVKGSQNGIFLEEAIKYILADKKDEKKLCRQEGYWKKEV